MKLSVSQLRKIIKEEVSRMLREEEAPETAEVDPQKAKDLAAKMLKANPEILHALASLGGKQLNKFVAGAKEISEMPPEEIEAETENVVSESESKVVTDQDFAIEFLGYLSGGGASIMLALQQLYNASPAGLQRAVDLVAVPTAFGGSTQSTALAIGALATGIALLGTAGIKALDHTGGGRYNVSSFGDGRHLYEPRAQEDEGMMESRRRTLRRR